MQFVHPPHAQQVGNNCMIDAPDRGASDRLSRCHGKGRGTTGAGQVGSRRWTKASSWTALRTSTISRTSPYAPVALSPEPQ